MVHTGKQYQVEHDLQHNWLEAEMVDRNKYGAIRELAAQHVPKKKIARQLGVTVKTVRQVLKRPQWEPYQRQKAETTVLSQFEQWVISRAPEVDFNAAILFRELKLCGYTGGYDTVKLFVRPLREEHNKRLDAVMRFETAPGRQGQVDWGSACVWVGDVRIRVHFFAMVLGYSRRLFGRGYLDERLPTLLSAHQDSLGAALLVQAQLAINAVDPLVVPAVTFASQRLEALPETPARMPVDHCVDGLNDLGIAVTALGRLVIGRPRKPEAATASLHRQAVFGD